MNYLTISPKDNIQQALNYLDNSHGAVLRLLPGIYIEDVEFPSNITLEGTGVADFNFTVIKGNHRFPKKGKIAFNHLKFESTSSTFLSYKNSDISFLFRSCVLQIKKGYPIYVPNTNGLGIFFDCWIYGDKNGFLNNEDGKIHVKFFNLTSESKDSNAELILNESSLFFNARITHKICLCGHDSEYDIQGGSWFEHGYSIKNGAKVNIGASNIQNL